LRATSQRTKPRSLKAEFSQESEVELLSPYVQGSLAPTQLVGPVSTRVRRRAPQKANEGMRAAMIVAGGFLVVFVGLAAGVFVVVAAGIR